MPDEQDRAFGWRTVRRAANFTSMRSMPLIRAPGPLDRRAVARELADQAFSRAAGAPLVAGNAVRLLRDATENYPAWLAALERAEHRVSFESYIIEDDEIGQRFADVLIEKALQGVRVRLIYDWLGSVRVSRRFWRRLAQSGVDVRCFNPLRWDSPLGWVSRDHRKCIVVDGEVGFVSGLCVAKSWVGDPAAGLAPWRDTGVEVRGPAVADLETAFGRAWAAIGEPMPSDEIAERGRIPAAGDILVRVIADMPATAGLLRLDSLIAAGARESLWISDAYFVGTPTYVQWLRSAAIDGVDVRILVPGAGSDVALVQALSRSSYRPLLEAGVRVFEWNGPMMHAKTSVADGRWARVGSTNLNLASWVGNWELDVAVEDAGFGEQMQRMYLQDLDNSTEIVLGPRRVQAVPRSLGNQDRRRQRRAGEGSARRLAAGMLTLGGTVGTAMTNHRLLGPAESRTMFGGAIVLLVLAAVGALWPRVLAFPIAALAFWIALSLLGNARKIRRQQPAAPLSQTPQPLGEPAPVAPPK